MTELLKNSAEQIIPWVVEAELKNLLAGREGWQNWGPQWLSAGMGVEPVTVKTTNIRAKTGVKVCERNSKHILKYGTPR